MTFDPVPMNRVVIIHRVEISNMFNIGSQPTVMKSLVESANSGLESSDYNADYNADPAKVWVRAYSSPESADYTTDFMTVG